MQKRLFARFFIALIVILTSQASFIDTGAQARRARGRSSRYRTTQKAQSDPIGFSVLAKGTMSNYEGMRAVKLVTNEQDWRLEWESIRTGEAAPESKVNFNERAVVVVYQGQKPSGGYDISITRIRRPGQSSDHFLIVEVEEQSPAPDQMTTQVITSPYVVVSIPRPPGGTVIKFAGRETEGNSKKQVRPRKD